MKQSWIFKGNSLVSIRVHHLGIFVSWWMSSGCHVCSDEKLVKKKMQVSSWKYFWSNNTFTKQTITLATPVRLAFLILSIYLIGDDCFYIKCKSNNNEAEGVKGRKDAGKWPLASVVLQESLCLTGLCLWTAVKERKMNWFCVLFFRSFIFQGGKCVL